MRSDELVRVAGAVVDVAVPARPGRVAGVGMAGFRSTAAAPIDLRMIPYPAVTVFFDFGDALLVDDARGLRRRGRSVVLGMGPGRLRGYGQDVEVLQVRLSPVAAHAVLGVPGGADGPGAAVVGLDELWGPDAGIVRRRLRDAGSWDERFAVMDDVLARRWEPERGMDPEVAHAWTRMVTSRGQVRVEGLAGEVAWSRQRLWSRFRAQVGLTPKRAATLVRFDHIAHRLAAGHNAARVAAEDGFADQSHLCRDVMAFAGMTPSALATAPWLAVDDIAWPTAY
ncbi:helix-turn-helix domain-containing protein [Dactylosporangium sp. NPDC051541]|uniref:helix-turn-helix domain-containing protein n=1 Tax=Dactylosporangium sp. NPDC051541 TaxID=3363977 RepID=UPI00379FDE85